MGSILTELTVLFMREFGWELEYAEKTIGEMPIGKLNRLVEELNFQRQGDAYERAQNSAAIMATIVNTTHRKDRRTYKTKDFIGQPPKRRGEGTAKTLRQAAEDIGIRIPEGGTV